MSHLHTVFAGLASKAILEDIEGELGRKFLILGSEYGADLNISRHIFGSSTLGFFNDSFQSVM